MEDDQDSSDPLLAEGPAELLARPLEDYADFLRSWRDLRPDRLEAVDYALRHTVVRLLVRAAPEPDLGAAYGALRRLVPVEREPELGEWLPRWRGFADLLDARRAALAAQDPAAARRLAHSGTILDLVARQAGLTQAAIAQQLNLKPANLSRILGVLEAHELIERRSVGREKRVYPGRLLTADTSSPPAGLAGPGSASDGPNVGHNGGVQPGRYYFFLCGRP